MEPVSMPKAPEKETSEEVSDSDEYAGNITRYIKEHEIRAGHRVMQIHDQAEESDEAKD